MGISLISLKAERGEGFPLTLRPEHLKYRESESLIYWRCIMKKVLIREGKVREVFSRLIDDRESTRTARDAWKIAREERRRETGDRFLSAFLAFNGGDDDSGDRIIGRK